MQIFGRHGIILYQISPVSDGSKCKIEHTVEPLATLWRLNNPRIRSVFMSISSSCFQI